MDVSSSLNNTERVSKSSSAFTSACFRLIYTLTLTLNPGIVWHPETGQCVKTKLETEAVRSRTIRKFEIDATKAENL
jgi:hypothetical protein